jgi:putative heme-binding domain-containing protein
MTGRRLLLGVLAAVCAVAPGAWSAGFITQGDRIAFIGNGLADRMQHHGWLETYLHGAYPHEELVIRNMGFTGDQVSSRPRNQGFMEQDDYLTHVGADVIFAFFGYNESFAHNPEKFKAELVEFIAHTRSQHYNGKSATRLVLFSPIAHENLELHTLPDGSANNLWLSIYTDAMARVAHEQGVAFVDLYAPSAQLYADYDEPLTINGVHLNEAGNRAVAKVIVEALGGDIQEGEAERIRTAVLEKNWCWYNRYRATDGNDVWGSRSTLEFVDGQTNAVVLQHELVMLDIMAANRDAVIWEAIRGNNTTPNDSNVPDPIPVKTNFQPSDKNGELAYTTPEEGLATLTLAEGLEANIYASEVMFPELINPVQMDVDTQGRIWVAVWETYPKWQPDHEMTDRLLILPDHDHDGVADEAITFDYIHNPTGFTFWNGGVLVASAPDIWFLKDTDGDDRADYREVWFSAIDSGDTHHAANNFDIGPGGYIYYQRGVFLVSNIETPWQSAQLSGATGMYRFDPRTHRFSFHADNSPNPHGGDFDYWGYQYATDATSGRAFQVRMDGDGKFKMHQLLEKTVRPVPSSGMLSSQHFPEDMDGNYIILNSIGFLGIKQYTLENTEGEVWGTEAEDLLVSSDGNFRPADYKVGEDGALYIADWANPLIGHMQHNIRDPSRDHEHGRVYRITAKGRPLQERVPIDGESIDSLLDVLKHPVDGVRLRARIELSERPTGKVMAAVQRWIQQFDATKPEDAHHLLEALWLHQQFNVVNEGLLALMLESPEPHARRAAERVKYLWEIEGELGMKHAGMHHAAAAEPAELVLGMPEQEPTPDPVMDGDTMVVHIQTLIEQMRYDRTAFAVEPEMKVRIEFSNPDAMDHNMIMVQPGAAADVAMAAMMLGADGIEKAWTPDSDQILWASKLLSVEESDTIEFVAPKELGEYDYICTYPGHWQLMRGVMHVVEDAEGWMAAYESSWPPPGPKRKFVKEWTVADFADDLDKPGDGRSLERGEEVFAAATCVTCHKPQTEGGGTVGPDLAGATERLDPAAMLVEVLDPSKVIHEDYKTSSLVLTSFEEVHGLIVEETDDYVRLVENPLEDTEGRKIPRDTIAEMTTSELSTMPVGLLNSFSKDDVLDLLTYLRR